MGWGGGGGGGGGGVVVVVGGGGGVKLNLRNSSRLSCSIYLESLGPLDLFLT